MKGVKVIDNTNLLELTVTGDSPQKTFSVIRSIMRNYPNLSQYITTSMVMEVLAAPKVPTTRINFDDSLDRGKRAFVIAFAALMAFFAYLSYKHDTVKSERELSEKLDATALGTIDHERVHRSGKKNRKKMPALLVTDISASFTYVEKYKKITASVLKSLERHNGQVIMVTSVTEHEGKSTVAANLALTMKRQKKNVILVDDMVDTAGTLCNGAKALVERGGAKSVIACATHGVLSGPAIERLQNSVIDKLILLDTIPVEGDKAIDKIEMLTVADLFAEAIHRIYDENAISDLYN